MLNLNINTLYSKLKEQPRGVFEGLVSASFVLYGGGGGGVDQVGGGGGGAGMVVSGSFNIVKQKEYTVIVGSGRSGSIYDSGSATPQGEDSWIYGWNNNDFTSSTVKAGGGFSGGRGGGINDFRNGGHSGNGYYYFAPNVSSSFPFYSGSDAKVLINSFGAFWAAGAGGGSATSGSTPSAAQSNGVAGNGGDGYRIISSSFNTYGFYEVVPLFGSTDSNALGAAGGGGGGILTESPNGGDGGDFGGGTGRGTAIFRSDGFGPGGGGGGRNYQGTSYGGNGGDGRCYLIYCGSPKLIVTNASTTYYPTTNTTVHIFNKGTGSFKFTEQFFSVPGCQ